MGKTITDAKVSKATTKAITPAQAFKKPESAIEFGAKNADGDQNPENWLAKMSLSKANRLEQFGYMTKEEVMEKLRKKHLNALTGSIFGGK